MPGLPEGEIAKALGELPAWERSGDAIVRTVRFAEFMDGIRFVSRVAELAEAADHHPDIDIRYRNVTFSLTTHDQGGLTHKDFDMARRINEEMERQQGKGGQA
ncbi:MAG: transcriptional coactivator/pterin dehydratase [Chloroflexi bacterium]|nr:transcriptional coactivator/pterin dehydratase [Chloroflexota bacterium]